MTTIVATKTCMAADQQVSKDGGSRFHTTKIRRYGKTIVGCSGDCLAVSQFLEWWPKQAKRGVQVPRITEDMEALVLTPAGLFHYDQNCFADEVNDAYYAIGTGSGYALGAMFMGADPVQAIEAAAKHDLYTGGPIDVLEL